MALDPEPIMRHTAVQSQTPQHQRRLCQPTRPFICAWGRAPAHCSYTAPPHHPQEPSMSITIADPTVVIRAARGSDGDRLAQLARLDSQRPLAGEVLVAEQGGELVAALGADRVIADPFRPTSDLVALLRVRSGGAPATSPRRGIARIPHLRTA